MGSRGHRARARARLAAMMDPLPRAPVCAVRRGRKDGAMVAEPKVRVAWSPRGNPAQLRLLKCQVFEIFFGGARGGGKTDGILGEFGAHGIAPLVTSVVLAVGHDVFGPIQVVLQERDSTDAVDAG